MLTNEGDTISGQIYDSDWSTGLATIQFLDDQRTQRQFTAKTSSGFFVARRNEWWVSKQFTFSEAPPVGKDNTPTEITKVSVTAFVKVLFTSSAVSLYEHTDQYSLPHFLLQKEGDFFELINYQQVLKRRCTVADLPSDGSSYLVKYEYYKERLTNGFADCPSYKLPKTLTYDAVTLVNVLGGYCMARQGDVYQSAARPPVMVQVLAGLSLLGNAVVNDNSIRYVGGHVYMRINNTRNFGRYYAQLGYSRVYRNEFYIDYFLVQGGYKLTANQDALIRPYVEGGVCTLSFVGDQIPLSMQLGVGVLVARRFALSVQKLAFVDKMFLVQASFVIGKVR